MKHEKLVDTETAYIQALFRATNRILHVQVRKESIASSARQQHEQTLGPWLDIHRRC